jgi:hypothetical protein
MALSAIASPRQRGHLSAMTKPATKRPEGIVKPAHWSNEPVPRPRPGDGAEENLSPTRYGDWVRNGIAVDF